MGLEEVITNYPIYSLIVISVAVTTFSTIMHKWLTNQEHLKNLKKRQKEIQKELRGCKDPSVMSELNAEMLKLTGVMMKSSFRPLFVTFLPLLLLFFWLRGIYDSILDYWIWYYIGFSIASSMIVRKLLKVA